MSKLEDWYDEFVETVFGPGTQLAIGWVCTIGGLVCWPLSHIIFAKDEPTTVLAISWAAIIIAGIGLISAADANRHAKRQSDNNKGN